MRKSIQWGVAAGLAFALAGCGLPGIGGPATAPVTGPPVVITENVPPSALLAVLNGPAFGPALAGLVNATARPREDLAVLQAGAPPETVLSSASPAPPTVAVAGKPAASGGDETSYQAAQYAGRLKHWRGEVAAGRRAEATQIRDAQSAWLRGLGLRAKARQAGRPAGPAEQPGSPRARPPPVPWPASRRRTATSSAPAA